MKHWILIIILKCVRLTAKVVSVFGSPGRFVARQLNTFTQTARIYRHVYARYFDKLSIEENTVLYVSDYGSGMRGNGYAIFKSLIEDSNYKHLQHVWVIDDQAMLAPITEQFKHLKNVTYVRSGTRAYLRYLASAKYLFNDHTFGTEFVKKQGQIYINVWHGTPLKHLGYAHVGKYGGLASVGNPQRNFMMADYIVHENRYTSEVWLESYKQRDIWQGAYIEQGYPRADLTLRTDKKTLIQRLQKCKVDICVDKKIILYAPTFKGSFHRPTNTMPVLLDELAYIQEHLNDPHVQVLLKVHPALYKAHVQGNTLYESICIPNIFDVNEILSITDVLITDYSSLFVDFLTTKRPIIFNMPDLSAYAEERGLYLDVNLLPGPACGDISEVVAHLNNLEQIAVDYQQRYDNCYQQWSYKNDGNSAKRVVETIFLNKHQAELHRPEPSQKKKILLYPGNLDMNGITVSLLSLLSNLDYTQYDVSLFINLSNEQIRQSVESLREQIPPQVRWVFREGYLFFTFRDLLQNDKINIRSRSFFTQERFDSIAYDREAKRIFGGMTFDHVIDFGGYDFLPTALLSRGFEHVPKTIFLHNDIQAEKELRYPWLQNIINIYHRFNRIASVSDSVMLQNIEKLGHYAPDARWCTVTNTLNLARILNGATATEENTITLDGRLHQIQSNADWANDTKFDLWKLPAGELENNDGSVSKLFNFIHNARLSPEKRHDKLFEALAILKRQLEPNQRIKVYLIGTGPLEEELKKMAQEMDILDMLAFMGVISNPFLYLVMSDALILSSDHEGQGLVLLEAMTLGIPTISTDIPQAVELAEDGKYGITTPNNPEGLAQGIMDFIRERPQFGHFDAQRYNARALEQFYSILE